jgi:hypothetical protein
MRILGIALIVFGIVALAYGGFTYTTREKVLQIGSLQATALREKTVPIAPIAGIAALVGGLALVFLVKPRNA